MSTKLDLKMHHEVRIERWFLLVWTLVSLWILACALLVKGEYGDGYQTMVNGRFLFGDATNYYVQRGPLAAFAMFPVEMLRGWFDWSALDVRPYHIYSGLLHSLYLYGCWHLLKRSSGDRVAQFTAFIAAILSIVFYANAPHLSHDIIPGLLFLILIFLCNRWLNTPGKKLAIQLILLGTAVTFIKQTYAIFWVALIVYAISAYAFKWDDGRVSRQKLLTLFGLAAVSGIISWLGYGFFIAPQLPDASVLRGPLDLMRAVSGQYGEGFDEIFSADLYLRNIHNYGIAAMLLTLPGLVLAFRGSDARLRIVAVCWLVCVVAMQMLSFREVRYLAYLAPLTAFLIVPVITLLARHKAAMGALLVILLFDQYRSLTVSAAMLSSTGGVDVERFVSAPDGNGRVIFSRTLNFAYMPASPMQRDPYHGIYHLTALLYRRLNENDVAVVELYNPADLGGIGVEAGDRIIYSNVNVLRMAPWTDDNTPSHLPNLVMAAGNAQIVKLQRQDDDYVVEDSAGRFFMLIPSPDVGRQIPLISSKYFRADDIARIYGEQGKRDELSVIGVFVKALCQAENCTYE